ILVLAATVVCLAGLGFGLIRYQYVSLKLLAGKKVAQENKLRQMTEAVKHADQLQIDLAQAKKSLACMESDIASGDLYSWMIATIRGFKGPYKVEVPSFSPIGPVTEVNLLANFPYKQTSLSISGTAHFHDLCRFLAYFENQFPHVRLLNLNLDLYGGPSEPELLSLRIDLTFLVKLNASRNNC